MDGSRPSPHSVEYRLRIIQKDGNRGKVPQWKTANSLRFERDSTFLLTLPPWQFDSFSRMHKNPPHCLSLALAATFFLVPAFAASPLLKPAHLTCDSLDHPLGIDSSQPLLSWQLQDAGFAARQTAYRIEVATKPAMLSGGKPDVWDSGRVVSDKSFGVVYGGPELAASTRYYWRVEVWDKDGKPYPASEVSWWETGLLKENWKAQWIGYEDSGASRGPQIRRHMDHECRQRQRSPGKCRYAARFSLQVPAQRAGETRRPVRNRQRLCCGMGERQAGAGDGAAAALEAGALEDLPAPGCHFGPARR